MFQITVDNRQATVEERELLTSGSRGIEVQFNLSAEWDGLIKTAVFRDDDDENTQIDVVIIDTPSCVIPWETLEESERVLFAGIYGTDTEGNVVIPTVWVSLGVVKPGVKPGNASGADPTPSQWAQIRSLAVSAEESAAAAEAYAEHQPVIGEDGYWYTWDGTTYVTTGQKAQGETGDDGVSPEVSIASVQGGHSVTITDADHPSGQSFNVLDGADGADGDDGVSPAVTVTTITGGHAVTITDASHPTGQTFNVMDGEGSAIDDTLTQPGEAADAKAAGDAIGNVRNTLSNLGLTVVDGKLCAVYNVA